MDLRTLEECLVIQEAFISLARERKEGRKQKRNRRLASSKSFGVLDNLLRKASDPSYHLHQQQNWFKILSDLGALTSSLLPDQFDEEKVLEEKVLLKDSKGISYLEARTSSDKLKEEKVLLKDFKPSDLSSSSTPRTKLDQKNSKSFDDFEALTSLSLSDDMDSEEEPHAPKFCFGPVTYNCSRELFLFPALAQLYAKLGLHWYNMLEGTNFVLHHLETIRLVGNLVFDYDITLRADDPDTGTQQLLRVDVSEDQTFVLDFRYLFVGKADTPKKPFIYYEGSELPEWPSENALNDRKRFYVMQSPEVCTDLIYLYLRLVVCAQFRCMTERELSYFEPVEVVIETIEQVSEEKEPLSEIVNAATSAIFYITFKDTRISDPAAAVSKALVRRVFDKRGFLNFDGTVLSGSLFN